jgi:hypothetical protein
MVPSFFYLEVNMTEANNLSRAQDRRVSQSSSQMNVLLGVGALALAGTAVVLYQWNRGYREKYQSTYGSDGNRFVL